MTKRAEIDINLFKSGDANAFKTIYKQYYNLVAGLVREYINDATIVEEIVQDVFLELWKNRKKLSPQTNFRNYLYTLAKHRSIDVLRKTLSEKKYISATFQKEQQFNYDALKQLNSSRLEYDELMHILQAALKKLPKDIAITFEMNRLEGLKYKEIAAELGISIKTIEFRISKALSFLRKELKDYLPLLFIIAPNLL